VLSPGGEGSGRTWCQGRPGDGLGVTRRHSGQSRGVARQGGWSGRQSWWRTRTSDGSIIDCCGDLHSTVREGRRREPPGLTPIVGATRSPGEDPRSTESRAYEVFTTPDVRLPVMISASHRHLNGKRIGRAQPIRLIVVPVAGRVARRGSALRCKTVRAADERREAVDLRSNWPSWAMFNTDERLRSGPVPHRPRHSPPASRAV